MKNVLVVYGDGEVERKKIAGSELSFLQRLVGGNIEIVLGRDYSYVVNEEGVVIGMPVNPIASTLMIADGWMGQFVLGTVVITSKAKNGLLPGLTDVQLEKLTNMCAISKRTWGLLTI